MIGENDPDTPEFKFVYYNGKTRQNTYEGAFVYSRSRQLEPESMKKVYAIAQEAGMNPDQFCKIRNGCFAESSSSSNNINNNGPQLFAKETATNGAAAATTLASTAPNSDVFRGIMASTKVSELLGVEAVSARDDLSGNPTSLELQPEISSPSSSSKLQRPWWYEVGDYLENPHRHFETMYNLRQTVEWPEDIVKGGRQP